MAKKKKTDEEPAAEAPEVEAAPEPSPEPPSGSGKRLPVDVPAPTVTSSYKQSEDAGPQDPTEPVKEDRVDWKAIRAAERGE